MLEMAAGSLLVATLAAHILSTLLAGWRCRAKPQGHTPAAGAPAVTLLRPVCGPEAFDTLTLGSTFRLDYPNLRVIFCCDSKDDPAARLVTRLIRDNPGVDARLLIGRTPLTANPKLNNLLKSWPHVKTDWVVIADSNVEMPPDYVQRLIESWRSDTGVLCSPPIGSRPAGFWGELECAFLNTYQARWQYSADTVGSGYAQGKTMVFRRRDLEASGGLVALGSELAEDAAATKFVRGIGLRARLVDNPFPQPLGVRSLRQVWDRQARWARLRRRTFPLVFAPEILTSSLVPIACAAWLAAATGTSPWTAGLAAALFWYGAEAALSLHAGWHYTWRSPLAAMLRDVLLPAVWTQAWFIGSFTWRGNQVVPDEATPASQSA